MSRNKMERQVRFRGNDASYFTTEKIEQGMQSTEHTKKETKTSAGVN